MKEMGVQQIVLPGRGPLVLSAPVAKRKKRGLRRGRHGEGRDCAEDPTLKHRFGSSGAAFYSKRRD